MGADHPDGGQSGGHLHMAFPAKFLKIKRFNTVAGNDSLPVGKHE